MEYLYAGIVVVAILICVYILLKIDKNKKRVHLESLLSRYGELIKSDQKSYDYILKTNFAEIKLKLVFIGPAKEFSINSPRHWQVKKAGSSNLLKTHGFEKLEGLKAILIFPKPPKLVKYINENEIVFVKPEEMCFDFYLFTEEDIPKINEIIT